MTAAGKINASNATAGDRILVDTAVRAYPGDEIGVSRTKTGATTEAVRILAKHKVSNRRGYVIETGIGSFYAEPIQTMILAPEDAAGIKRAHAEAKAEDEARTAAAPAATEAPTEEAPEAPAATPALDEADAKMAEMVAEVDAHTEARTARCDNPWHTTAPARARKLCPECPDTEVILIKEEVAEALAAAQAELAEALDRWLPAAPLGATLRPILEAGVRSARTIPEGRKRHGQTKARRDALRHVRKLELAGI